MFLYNLSNFELYKTIKEASKLQNFINIMKSKFSLKKIIALVALISLVSVIVIFSILKKKTTYDKLKNTWKYTAITDVNGNMTNKISEEDMLALSSDFSFTHKSIANNTFEKGLWRMNGKKLVLTIDFTVPIDSVVYMIENNKPTLINYSKGNLVSKSKNGKLSTKKEILEFEIEECTNEKLVLLKDDKLYVFSDKKLTDLKAKSIFTFNIMSILRGMGGLLVILLIAFIFSANRKSIAWRTVIIGLSIQILLALGITYIPAVSWLFRSVGAIFVVILDFTTEGSVFLLGDLLNTDTYGFIFAFQVLPTIIFFSALTSLLFYLGIIQKVVWVLAWAMTRLLKISGAESLSVAGNIFLGQTEAPLMIKAYLDKMNRSEIMLVMAGGMATLAGGVLAAYIAFLGGSDPVMRLHYAQQLLTASIMAAPGVIVISKIIVPQTEKISTDIKITKEKIGSNVLDAISNGTAEGLKLAANVAAMLLSFIAFIAMFNFILSKIGGWTGLNDVIHAFDPQYTGLNLRFLIGYTFAPLVGIIGVPWQDATLVGRLIGEKLIMTEFIAYVSLADLKSVGDQAFGQFTSEKSIIMATYALCGFANFASIGIQIGGIGTLAPTKRKMLSELGMRALLAGSLASLLSATIIGMFLVA